jgi:hypothetical protein
MIAIVTQMFEPKYTAAARRSNGKTTMSNMKKPLLVKPFDSDIHGRIERPLYLSF